MQDEVPVVNNPSETISKANLFLQFFSKIPRAFLVLGAVAITVPIVFLYIKNQGTAPIQKAKNEFTLVESAPSDQQNQTPVIAQPTFVFSKKIGVSEGDLNKYFNISPKVEGSWHLEKNGQVVYFSSDKKQPNTFPHTFDYRTTYTVTIDKSFRSDGNKTLADTEEVSFKTIPNPEFGLSTSKSLLPLYAGESVDLEVQTNQNQDKYSAIKQGQLTQPYDITIKKATKEELLQFFKYGKDSYLAVNHIPESLQSRSGIKTMGLYVYTKTGYTSNSSIKVLNPVFKTPGIYLVSFGNKYGSDNMFVVISNHVNQVVNDDSKSYVIVTDAKSNKANPNVKVEYYKTQDKIELLDTRTTDSDGIALSNTLKDNSDFVITTKGDDIAVTQTRTWRTGVVKEEDVNVFSYTDRPIYRPGDTVHYKAVIRIRDSKSGKNTIPNKTYYVKYVSGSDVKKGDYKTVATDENGTVIFDTVLPFAETNAYPQIVLASKNSKGEYASIDNLQLGVEFYKKPDMDITVTARENEYISRDTSHLTITGKTNYGQPLSNISFTYRVMLVDFSEVKDRSTEQSDSITYANYYGGGEELTSGSATFDQKGQAQIEVSTDMPKKFIQSQFAMIEITPNIGAVPSFGKIAKLIHRGEFALFLDDIQSDTSKGISGSISALNHKNPRIPVGRMKGKLYLTQKDMYSQSPGKLIETRDIELDSSGKVGFEFQNVAEGSYEVKTEFVDPRGNTVTVTQMTYAGKAKVYQQPLYSLSATFDKPSFKEGETAKAHITSSFVPDDIYIVTSENNGGSNTHITSVKRRQEEGKTQSFEISIPITHNTPIATGINLYAVKGGQVVQGQAQFTVIRKIPEVKTTILFDKNRYKPGDTVTATLLTKDEDGKGIAADNSLSIIDASLLQLGKQKTGISGQFNPANPSLVISHFDSTTGIYADGPGGMGGCFLEGTKILMGDGTTKNIEDVTIGDTVLTKKREDSLELVKNEVTNTFRHIVTEYILINNRLKVTPIHRIYLNKKWAVASDAAVGDTLVDENGNDVAITSIAYQEGIFKVYNLTTSPNHTFFADGIYVHNDKGMDARQNFVDTLYWNPHIATDNKGKATVKFKLADNVTTFTGAAYSNTKDSLFGEATASIKSYKDLTLIPSIANFYYENDKPVISVLVQNSTGNDIDITITSSVKELPGINSQNVHVKGNDMEVINVPLDLSNIHDFSTFIIEAKDKSGKLLDSVLMKKPLLPQGNIVASWQSYENSFDHKFTTQFPKLDVNRLTISIVPNAVAKLFQDYLNLSYNLSVETGQDLYAFSYILARTRDGFIDPTAYHYAKIKNDFINTIDNLSTTREEKYWNFPPNNYSKDSLEDSNLWVVKGLEQANSVHMLDEITNVKDLIKSTKDYFKVSTINGPLIGKSSFGMPPPPPMDYPLPTVYPSISPVAHIEPSPLSSGPAILTPPLPIMEPTGPIIYLTPTPFLPSTEPVPQKYYSDAEKVIRSLVYGEQYPNDAGGFDRTSQGLALKVLNGDLNSIATLLAQKIISADDRYFWSEYEIGDQAVLPIMALVEKGSSADAEKAIRGLSFNTNEMSPLAIYSAIKYAERKNIYVSKPSVTVTVNGDQEFSYPNDAQNINMFPSFVHTYSTASSKDGTVNVRVESDNKIPVYATVTEFSYNRITNTLKVPPGKGNYKYLDFNFARAYKDTTTGETVPEVGLGKTGAVVLSADIGIIVKGTMITPIYSFMSEDALSPNYIYLDQSDAYYTPQFQSVLKKLFSSPATSYTLPSMYSDQAVFFDMNANTRIEGIVLPYVVYNSSGGTYFRPKTSIVLPILGIISTEK